MSAPRKTNPIAAGLDGERLSLGVAARLSRYLQVLTQAKKMEKDKISSQELARFTHVNPTQIRRDLLGAPWRPFSTSAVGPRKVARLARPLVFSLGADFRLRCRVCDACKCQAGDVKLGGDLQQFGMIGMRRRQNQ